MSSSSYIEVNATKDTNDDNECNDANLSFEYLKRQQYAAANNANIDSSQRNIEGGPVGMVSTLYNDSNLETYYNDPSPSDDIGLTSGSTGSLQYQQQEQHEQQQSVVGLTETMTNTTTIKVLTPKHLQVQSVQSTINIDPGATPVNNNTNTSSSRTSPFDSLLFPTPPMSTISSPNKSSTIAATTISTNKRNYRVLADKIAVSGVMNSSATSSGSSSSSTIPTNHISSANNTSISATKWVTREIAALDFLLNIPLEKEESIVQEGWKKLQKQKQHQEHDSEEDEVMLSDSENTNDYFHVTSKYTNDVTSRIVPKGNWWEKWIKAEDTNVNNMQIRGITNWSTSTLLMPAEELERPTFAESTTISTAAATTSSSATPSVNTQNAAIFGSAGTNIPANTTNYSYYAPGGRRLEGDDAVRIQIPTNDAFVNVLTKQKTIARQAALKEWEIQTAHGLSRNHHPPMLDGRVFFSVNSSYPISVFSMIRYEPKREEAAFRRRKLEAIGGGGSQFAMPVRDWRGISYRALLPRKAEKYDKKFNRFIRKNLARTKLGKTDMSKNIKNKNETSENDELYDNESTSSSSSSSSSDSDDNGDDWYVPGLLDDPEMVLGRHRNVMIGDHVIGPIVSSTIQFVEPALLKAELNKQFRERFDGWEPPKAARKYIGARILQGNYVLMDPTDDYDENNSNNSGNATGSKNNNLSDDENQRIVRRPRQGSIVSTESGNESSIGGPTSSKEKVIRMPPSLTLSKIRSIKAQALQAAVRANLEISTVALACVYFERLCLDCRVDKSNRRLAFSACLLLSSKLNEANTGIVMMNNQSSSLNKTSKAGSASDDEIKESRMQALIRPNKRSSTMFASFLEFFTQDWSLSLKHLFDAEWGVFAALGFNLSANPAHVSFHFKRLMKALERNPVDYLGREMFSQWQEVLADEEERRLKRERKNEARRKRKEERILNMHIEIENEVLRRKNEQRLMQSNPANSNSTNYHEELERTEKSKLGQITVAVLRNQHPHPSTRPAAASPVPPVPTAVLSAATASLPVSSSVTTTSSSSAARVMKPKSFLHRFTSTMRRSVSQEKISLAGYHSNAEISSLATAGIQTHHDGKNTNCSSAILRTSPSMPEIANSLSDPGVVAIDIHPGKAIGYDMDADSDSIQHGGYDTTKDNSFI